MGACACNVGLGNTGLPNCVPIMSVAKKIVVVNYKDSDGNINKIDCNDTLNQAYFDALVNNDDKSKAWFPYPEIFNIEDLKADSIFETLNDGTNLFIQEGTRTFSGVMPNKSPEFLGQIKSARCVEIGVFIIDADGSIIGNGSEEGFLRPIRVNNQTWNATLVKTTDTESQKVALTFEYNKLERDEDLRMILSTDLSYDVLNDMDGIVDVVFKNIASTTGVGTSTVSFDLETIYGSQCAKVIVQGLGDPDATDFSVSVDGTPETPTGVTESPAGSYVLNTSDLTGGEELVVSIAKNGFEALSGNTTTA